MARAIRTLNTPNCVCHQDHDALEFIVMAVLESADRHVNDGETVMHSDIAMSIAKVAEEVGWVKAGDELEDLRLICNSVMAPDYQAPPDPTAGFGPTYHPEEKNDDDQS